MKVPEIQKILDNPSLYNIFDSIISKNSREIFVREYIRPIKDCKILDIGCGTGDIVKFLPVVNYFGFDYNKAYIDKAKQRFFGRGVFEHLDINHVGQLDIPKCNIVLAIGVLHHLNDEEVLKLLHLASSNIEPNGRLVTLDGCIKDDQPKMARFLLSMDRGKYVRTKEEYLRLIQQVFPNVKAITREDFMRLPYTHIIMECSL